MPNIIMSIKKIFTSVLTLALSTVWLFNFSAGIVGGIWLAFTGGLGLIITGLIFGVIMPWIFPFATLPSFLLIKAIPKLEEGRHRFLVSILVAISAGYEKLILAVWVSFIFGWLVFQTHYPSIALWLWGYATVMGPISYMAAHEGPDAGLGTSLGILFTQLAYFVLTINLANGGSQIAGYGWLWLLIFIFTGFMAWMGFLLVPRKETIEVKTGTFSERITTNIASGNFCPQCGYSNLQIAKFCKNCGNIL